MGDFRGKVGYEKMEQLKPKLFSVLKTYSKEQFVKDLIAGVIVAIIALPLSIALALASGVTPEKGLYTAIIAGFVISFLGGSRVQIAGPTAAFATIVAGIVATDGMDGLILATILAGIILIIMGICHFGNLIRFIPYTITTGFTTGIAVTIVIGQLKDFMGVTYQESPVETMEKLQAVLANIATLNWQAVAVGILSLAILIVWPKINAKIPGSLIAVLVASALVALLPIQVNTIGSLYEISSALPQIRLPRVSLASIRAILPDAFTIAILAAIESLLSCVVADSMIGDRHNSNMELVAQGAGNICSGLFGGIPATGAIARTAANIKNGGRSPVAGMVHALVLLLILVVLMPYAALIPMPTIAAILFMVAYNMSEWRKFLSLVKTAPKSDILVLLVTFFLTIVFDLVLAIEVGIVITAFLFMKRMSDVTNVSEWIYKEDSETTKQNLKAVPKHTQVYEITGPMFFAAADKLLDVAGNPDAQIIILRMRSVPAMDATALNSLKNVYKACQKRNTVLLFSHVNPQPMSVMKKARFDLLVGKESFCKNIDEALEKAKSMQEIKITAK